MEEYGSTYGNPRSAVIAVRWASATSDDLGVRQTQSADRYGQIDETKLAHFCVKKNLTKHETDVAGKESFISVWSSSLETVRGDRARFLRSGALPSVMSARCCCLVQAKTFRVFNRPLMKGKEMMSNSFLLKILDCTHTTNTHI